MKRLKRYEYYERIFTFFADELTVVSEDTRDTYLSLGVPARKIHVVPNGVAFTRDPILERSERLAYRPELVAATPALTSLAQDSWLLYMARIHGRKGQDHAVALWSALPEAVRGSSVLIFVGPETEAGQLDRLKALISSAPDRERIVLAGPAQNPAAWLEASDVYLSCSEFEGMPLGPIEAAGAGLPLLLSLIPGHAILAKTSCNYDLADAAAGARELRAALAIPGTRAGHEALKLVSHTIRAGYSLGAMASKYERLYGKGWVIKTRGPAPRMSVGLGAEG
jgi:glycosyltransferase involved in cell wall biosynthesis